ncbi:MAG: acetate--CoA ligase family protein, partial [Woeseiaceae bacterium]
LDPLLRPRSVAVVGASSRSDSLGEWSLTNLCKGGFGGNIYPVNPHYEALQGWKCYPSLADLPEVPDLVIFGVGDQRIEAAFDEAIDAGVPAAVIMSTLVIDDDEQPVLRDRIQGRIDASGILLCGANGMGFYNVRDHVWACGFDSGMHEAPGNVSLLSHSGSGMCGLIDCDRRLRTNVAVSTGNELGVTIDEYLDFVLDLPETRVVGLFVETARDPDGFRAALDKAAQKQIPIVALKVGRTEEAAHLTVSHSGAMAGDDATYEALFDRYGVQRVRDMEELATTLIMFAELHPVGDGGLVTLHDSGGERQLMVDLADEFGVPLTTLSDATASEIAQVIDPELPAVNPLDGWSRGGPGAGEKMTRALSLLMRDDAAALGAMVLDRGPDGLVYPGYVNRMKAAHLESGKPVALVAARQGTGDDELAVTSTHEGFPVLDGVSPFLRGVRALFDYRDFLGRETIVTEEVDAQIVARWREQLQRNGTLPESESLAMLGEFGFPVVSSRPASGRNEILAAAGELGYPLVLKTEAPDIVHKTDQRGVVLDIRDEDELLVAYEDLSKRLGPRVLVATMVPAGIEMILGMRQDPQFGPVVIIGFGGIHAEGLHDVTFALPPFDTAHARRCIDRLQLRPLLDGMRGTACDIDAFAGAAARYSTIVHALRDELVEGDVNPVIVGAQGCAAVDALFVARRA